MKIQRPTLTRSATSRKVKIFGLFRRQGRKWCRMSDMGLPMDIASYIWRDVTVKGQVEIRKTHTVVESTTVSGRRIYAAVA